MSGATDPSTPPQAAVDHGHDLTWDPPAAITAARRWTCRRSECGAAAIRYGTNEYGSATEQRCPGAAEAKPLGRKAYGSIGHLPGSRLGTGDHHVPEGQGRICTDDAGGRRVFVQEKLDGTCVAVARIGDDIVPLIRAGYRAADSRRIFHRHLATWAAERADTFRRLLQPGERVVGEWLGLAHATRYTVGDDDVFVAFDLMTEARRAPCDDVYDRCHQVGLPVPNLVAEGATTVADAMAKLGAAGGHSAHVDDGPEGLVYRVESTKRGAVRVDFLAKYVRPDRVPGRYLVDTAGYVGPPDVDGIWNWRPRP